MIYGHVIYAAAIPYGASVSAGLILFRNLWHGLALCTKNLLFQRKRCAIDG
jgi:hypothetical protein